MRSRLCGIAHPRLRVDTLTEADLQVAHKLFHHLLGRSGEVAFAIHLAQRFAHDALHLIGGTLPKRVIFLATTHCAAKEVEVGFTNLITQIAGRTANQIPLHHSLHRFCVFGTDNLIESHHETGLSHYNLFEIVALHALRVQRLLQIDVRIVGLKFLQRHLIVVSLWIAQLGHTLRYERQHSLMQEHGLHFLLGHSLREAVETEHLNKVFLESLSNLNGRFVVINVIIFLAKRQSTLSDIKNIHRHILLISTES